MGDCEQSIAQGFCGALLLVGKIGSDFLKWSDNRLEPFPSYREVSYTALANDARL
jgi:hypothetical protein